MRAAATLLDQYLADPGWFFLSIIRIRNILSSRIHGGVKTHQVSGPQHSAAASLVSSRNNIILSTGIVPVPVI
jgi:hypothetical protein